MEIILIKNGTPRIFLTSEDVIDEKFLEILNGGRCRIVNNSKVEEDVTLSFGLLIEPADETPVPPKRNSLWNLFGLFKNI